MIDKFFEWARTSISLKLFVIGAVTFLLMIPMLMVSSVIDERGRNKNSVSEQIYAEWSGDQTLQGPILTIPYYEYYTVNVEYKDVQGNTSTKEELRKRIAYSHFLPDMLLIDGKISPEVRYRSIYEAVVYQSDLKVHGVYSKPDLSEWEIDEKDVLYDKASVTLGLSDLRGVKERIKIKFRNADYFFNPGIKSDEISSVIKSGVSVPVHFDATQKSMEFAFDLKLNGSESLFFLPYGKETKVSLQSTWNNPSFAGDFLPDSRKIDANGFSAVWKVVDINRAYPQSFQGSDIAKLKHSEGYYPNVFQKTSFGVNLRVPVDYYQKSSRSVKYGILVIILTFISFFFVEIFMQKRIHAFQYILVGFALVLFFALLISFSEHIGFNLAYAVSSFATIAAITLYAKSIFKSRKFVLILLGILALFYAFIFILLQLQDYSLILGTVMLFIVLSTVMYISKDIDWYNIKKG